MFDIAETQKEFHFIMENYHGGCNEPGCPYHWRPWFAWRPVTLERNEHRNKPQWAWWRTIMCRQRSLPRPFEGRWLYEEPFIVATFYPER